MLRKDFKRIIIIMLTIILLLHYYNNVTCYNAI